LAAKKGKATKKGKVIPGPSPWARWAGQPPGWSGSALPPPRDFLWKDQENIVMHFLSRQFMQQWMKETNTSSMTFTDVQVDAKHSILAKANHWEEVIIIDEEWIDDTTVGFPRTETSRQLVEYRIFHDGALAQLLHMVSNGGYSQEEYEGGMAPFDSRIYIPFYLEYDASNWERAELTIRTPPEGVPEPFQMVINAPPSPFMRIFESRLNTMIDLARRLNSKYPSVWLDVLANMKRDYLSQPRGRGNVILTIEDREYELDFKRSDAKAARLEHEIVGKPYSWQQVVIAFDEIAEKREGEHRLDVTLTEDEAKVEALERGFEQYIREHPDAPRDYPTIAVLMNKLEYFDLLERLGEGG